MDASGAGRLNRSSPSCLNRSAQRIDFFHGLLTVERRLLLAVSPTQEERTDVVRITGRWLLTFLLLGGSAAAQSAQTLITNDSVAYDGNTLELRQSGYDEIAQSFRAGPLASDGEMLPDGTRWVITEVRVRLNFEDTRQVPRARICTGYRGARPNNQEMDCPNGELSGPTRSSYGERVVTYTHRGYALNAGSSGGSS